MAKKKETKKPKAAKVGTEKILIKSDDEMIDVLGKIESSKAEKIILTFADPSDLLISPINLKVLLDSADEKGIPIIAQIVQNPVGMRNAKSAGMTATDATGSILDAFWEEAEHSMRGRNDRKKNMLKRSSTTPTEPEIVEPEIPEVVEEEVAVEKSDFQKKIEETIERSKVGLSNKSQVLEQGGFTIGLDQDISTPAKSEPTMVGKDVGIMKEAPAEEENTSKPDRTFKGLPFFAGIAAFFATLPAKVSAYVAKTGTKIILIRIVAPILIVFILSLWLAYRMLPLVRVRVYIESKPVSVEKVFSGEVGSQTFDFEQGIIPVKRETVEKSGSDNTNATGTAKRGNKAEGTVTLKFWAHTNNSSPYFEKPANIPAGTVLTSNNGLRFEVTTNTTVGEPVGSSYKSGVPVRALEPGSEYNLSAGNIFTVQGYSAADMTADNTSSFSGGSSEEYTVLSKQDVDSAVEKLQEDAYQAAENDLRDKARDGWEIITSTIKNEVDGEPKTDVPIGAEASLVNINIKTKSTALYFRRSVIEDDIDRIITQAARDQGLFESSTDATLELDEDLQQEVTVENATETSVRIRLVASSKVKPKVDREKIIEDLGGRGWDDGIDYLDDLNFATKPTEVTFIPDYFPKGLRHFPARQGRIIINIVEENSSE